MGRRGFVCKSDGNVVPKDFIKLNYYMLFSLHLALDHYIIYNTRVLILQLLDTKDLKNPCNTFICAKV